VELPTVFLVHAGHPHDTPHLPLTCHVTQQHREELVDIEPIGLRPALAPIDLNTGGIDDVVLDAMRYQGAVQPESVPARLVAADHSSVLR
jgi:hypothetical protein